ncbi:hypothetical protein [Baaleninema simplex]|uniref:hypothetical protein n=1 Tax=Baaleninema simplex TaxID=2862350 RepID=UPI00034DAE01|nr:hypothetical protein [Baaleninema simplex]
MEPTSFHFHNGNTATGIYLESQSDFQTSLDRLGLSRSRPVLVLVGGASKMEPDAFARLKTLFDDVLAPTLEKVSAIALDGGTDCGVMQLMGQARTHIDGTFPLIGVCAIGTVLLPDGTPPISDDAAPLEPNHSHFVLVPGTDWGAESPWLADLADYIANGFPACTLVSNGGEITWQDVSYSVKARRTTVVLAGSGRTADKLAAGLRGEPTDDRAEPLIRTGCLQVLDLDNDIDFLQTVVSDLLTAPSG